jgi:hypothetical protein
MWLPRCRSMHLLWGALSLLAVNAQMVSTGECEGGDSLELPAPDALMLCPPVETSCDEHQWTLDPATGALAATSIIAGERLPFAESAE